VNGDYKKGRTMSCFELRKFVFWCDMCKVQEIIEDIREPDLPKGWIYRSVGPCGLTNYYKKVEVCPKCAKEEQCP
jgi:hypothetical protein